MQSFRVKNAYPTYDEWAGRLVYDLWTNRIQSSPFENYKIITVINNRRRGNAGTCIRCSGHVFYNIRYHSITLVNCSIKLKMSILHTKGNYLSTDRRLTSSIILTATSHGWNLYSHRYRASRLLYKAANTDSSRNQTYYSADGTWWLPSQFAAAVVHMHGRQGHDLGAHTFLCVRPPGWPSKGVGRQGARRGKENLYITDVVVVAGCRRRRRATATILLCVRVNGVTSLRWRRSVSWHVMCYYSSSNKIIWRETQRNRARWNIFIEKKK